jgi:alpha-D-ribose 1-methylphosphonate 5-triphosphate synthase subunit PhnH
MRHRHPDLARCGIGSGHELSHLSLRRAVCGRAGRGALCLHCRCRSPAALEAFALGSDEYPERSATLVIEVSGVVSGDGALLRGPGIRDGTRLGVAGLPIRFWEERASLAELFPRGLDILFVSGHRLAALPRSTRIVQ